MLIRCKHCNIELNELNAAKKNKKYFRNECKPCRSKKVYEYQRKNIEHRKKYVNEYVRRIGRVRQYPCDHCSKLCYKKYGKSFCSDECRFLNYVLITNNCWLWMGARKKTGYGKFYMKKRHMIASRASFELFKGPLTEYMLVCHTCDNPPCVKPAHLWLGTNSENQLDSINKGRRKLKK